MRLILLRHGETRWNAEQRLQGQDNSELSERGVRQARQFTPYARALLPAQVISSDLGRTRETARIIGYPDAPSDPRLRELDMGEWTGRVKQELIREHPERPRARLLVDGPAQDLPEGALDELLVGAGIRGERRGDARVHGATRTRRSRAPTCGRSGPPR